MKRLVCVLLLVAWCAAGQVKVVKRLGQITYDPDAGVLTWTVQQGTIDRDRNFKSEKEQKYSINFQSATMSDGKETRRFSRAEAEGMFELFNEVVAKYARESTKWWTDPPKDDPEQPVERATKV